MNKRLIFAFVAVVVLAVALGGSLALAANSTWTGEVLDMACYKSKGAHGPDHAGCAVKCLKSGQPMGLLTDDGTVVLLVADQADPKPYEGLKDLGGAKAEVTGSMSDKDGIKVVTVRAFKPAA
jgi:hypothetical protein